MADKKVETDAREGEYCAISFVHSGCKSVYTLTTCLCAGVINLQLDVDLRLC